ncbi:MAG: 1-acyl-sn-glycerol-3-phosphate acyltransferase [Bacteroidales bacterium]|jgi:1-acyl-sn-glycerol-3-phosphate acyltransferase|nr:1-acyl-sn-glycerol-3-phosphate acyltransferase [Bacteroidales bacterium]
MKWVAGFLMAVFGWRMTGEVTPMMKNCVIVAAPHTSNWDFVWGRCVLWILGVNAKFMIKKELFIFPFGYLIKALGGVPVARGRKNNLVDTCVKNLKEHKNYSIVITPEGTRKYTKHWKKGFYEIAMKANVPIQLTWLDYDKKLGGTGIAFHPTGDYEADLVKIQDFYKDKAAKYPQNFNMSPQYQMKS